MNGHDKTRLARLVSEEGDPKALVELVRVCRRDGDKEFLLHTLKSNREIAAFLSRIEGAVNELVPAVFALVQTIANILSTDN